MSNSTTCRVSEKKFITIKKVEITVNGLTAMRNQIKKLSGMTKGLIFKIKIDARSMYVFSSKNSTRVFCVKNEANC